MNTETPQTFKVKGDGSPAGYRTIKVGTVLQALVKGRWYNLPALKRQERVHGCIAADGKFVFYNNSDAGPIRCRCNPSDLSTYPGNL